IFNSNLESVEEFGFGVLNFRYKVFCKVFIDDPVAGSKECEHVCDEVTFAVVEICPIRKVLTQIYFFSRPEAGLCLIIKLPNVVVLDGKKHKPVLVLLQNWFFQLAHELKRFIGTRKIFKGYQRRPIPETFSINFFGLEEADGYRLPVSSVQMKQNRSKKQNAVFASKITFVDNVWIECG